jgi:Putative peptidoglycan binding domain
MVRLIKKTMNVEVDIRVLWVPESAVNTGPAKDAPAWVSMPAEMPPYGSKSFSQMRLDMYLRKSFLAQSAYDQIAIAIAHELSHMVLDSIKHPLRRCEKAVDLTAMLLGFRSLYGSGSQKERRSQQRATIHQLGYLTSNEVQLADQIIREMQPSRIWEVFDRARAYLSAISYPRFHVQAEHRGLLILLGLCVGIGALILIANRFPERVSDGASVNASIVPPAQSTTGTVYVGKESTVSGAPPANQITQIQARLVQLGYLVDRPDGVWGARSRSALRAFKAANGLFANDFWDEEANSILFSPNAAYAPAPAASHAKR